MSYISCSDCPLVVKLGRAKVAVKCSSFFLIYFHFIKYPLSLFSKVRQSQTCGRLIFTLTAHTGHHQHHQRHHVGDHLVQFLILHMLHSGGNVEIQDVESAKQEGCQYADIGTPDRKDHQCDRQPSSVTKGIV